MYTVLKTFHVTAIIFPAAFLFLSEVFQENFSTHLPHVQLVTQDLSYCLLVHINHLSNHLNAEMPIIQNNSTDFLNIFFSF
jgi:hypothetical protein